MSKAKAIQPATSFATKTVSYEAVTFDGRPSPEDREAMKSLGGYARLEGETQTWVWYLPAGQKSKDLLDTIGRALLAKQTPPPVKVTTGSSKTAQTKAAAVAHAKAELAAVLSAQGRTPEYIKAVLAIEF
jgi:hypothetical protein